MKKLYLLFITILIAGSGWAQPLITYGNSSISKEEFLRAYNKNKPAVTDKEKSLRDYTELYSNFKLKVKAAQELRLDTLQQIAYDIENFRNQIIENYLSDEKGMKKLQDEAFTRSQNDLHVLHFSVPIAANALPADTLKAYKAIYEVYRQLKNGNNNYADIVNNNAPAKQADIGFITAFTVPYEYENIIYNTKPGEMSNPYRSKNGWHIFKVIQERESVGKWKIAQILFSFPPDADAGTKVVIKNKADSVYTLLQNGLTFGGAAKLYSNDKLTYLTDGEMPEFGAGKYAYTFENEIFKLKKDGEISQPFITDFGYHIVKRLAYSATPKNKADETYQFELKQKIMQDARINIEKDKFARGIVEKTGFKKSAAVSENDLYRYADSLMKNPTLQYTEELPISKKIIASFNKSSVKGSDWLKFVREYKTNYEQYKGETNQQLWNKFITVSSVDYYKKNLEAYNEDFRFQMQEFKEGNMLFEIMERNVWNKAIADSVGLLKYYNENKTKYKWAASADVLVFNCSTAKIAEEALSAMKNGTYWKTIAAESNAAVQADSGRYELTQVMGTNYTTNVVKDSYSAIVTNADGTAGFVKYLHIYEPNQPRSFEDAKGLVINDYQNVLEQDWLRRLKIKYPVKINEAVLKQLVIH
ncbi:MAG: peptidylprolyl isomerase [Ferruginibacter sp.]